MQCNLRFAEGWGAGWWAVHLDESQLGGGGGESGGWGKSGRMENDCQFHAMLSLFCSHRSHLLQQSSAAAAPISPFSPMSCCFHTLYKKNISRDIISYNRIYVFCL